MVSTGSPTTCILTNVKEQSYLFGGPYTKQGATLPVSRCTAVLVFGCSFALVWLGVAQLLSHAENPNCDPSVLIDVRLA